MMKNEIQYLLNTGSCSNHKFVCPQGPCGDSEGCDRFIPIFGGAHNRFNKYEECTLVYDPETLVAYISKRCVPTGVEITNRKYWQPMNVSGYADDNIIIFSDRNLAGQLVPYTLETAVPCVEVSGRKNGTIISFYSTTNIPHWEIWLYLNSDTCHWEELLYWKLVTNIYNKFVGWYNNLDELESIPVNDRVGKYALIGDTLIDAHIYKGTRYGWIDTGLNIYQKFFDDVCQEGTVTLTEELKKFFCNLIGALFKDDLVLELTRIFKNYHDYPDLEQVLRDLFADLFKWLLEHLDLYPDVKNIFELYLKKIIEKYANNEVTNFEVISHILGIGDFDMKYPTSIYSDCSKMITYNDTTGRKNESILEVPLYFTDNLDLKFTAGVWKGITNNGEEYCLCSKTPIDDIRQASTCCGADPWGFLRFNIPTYPRGMLVIVDDNAPIPYTDNFAVFCDGGSHVIEFIGALTYNVAFHYYKAPATGSYVGEEIIYNVSVVAGDILDPTNITILLGDVILTNTGLTNLANNYKGHNFAGWATNYKKYNTSGLNPYTDSDAIHSYNVVGKSNVTPLYFDFSTPINLDIDLYAWYNIPVTIYWEDTKSHTQDSCYNYGATIKAYNSPYEGPISVVTNGGNIYEVYPMLPNVAKEGYTLKGWTYNNKLYSGKVNPITIDGLVQATFDLIVTYTVTFKTNGGSPIPPSQTVVSGDKVVEPTEPTKDGYTFTGWYNGNQLYDFNTPVTSNLTLKAIWNEDHVETFTIDFDSDGGSPVDSQEVQYGERVIEPDDPYKNGYEFTGWTLNGYTYDFNDRVTSDFTLFATWLEVEPDTDIIISIPDDLQVRLDRGDCVFDPELPPTDPTIFTITKNGEPYYNVELVGEGVKDWRGHNTGYTIKAVDKSDSSITSNLVFVRVCGYVLIHYTLEDLEGSLSATCSPSGFTNPVIGDSVVISGECYNVRESYLRDYDLTMHLSGYISDEYRVKMTEGTGNLSSNSISITKEGDLYVKLSPKDPEGCVKNVIPYSPEDRIELAPAKEVTIPGSSIDVIEEGLFNETYTKNGQTYKVKTLSYVFCSIDRDPYYIEYYKVEPSCNLPLVVNYVYNNQTIKTETFTERKENNALGSIVGYYPTIDHVDYKLVNYSEKVPCSTTTINALLELYIPYLYECDGYELRVVKPWNTGDSVKISNTENYSSDTNIVFYGYVNVTRDGNTERVIADTNSCTVPVLVSGTTYKVDISWSYGSASCRETNVTIENK